MIFVDAWFFIALRNRADRNHAQAIALLGAHDGAPLLTSNHVRGETWTYLSRMAGLGAAVTFLDLIERSPRLSVERVNQELEDGALGWLRRHDEREYSFVDATSFALMRSLRLRETSSFDGDFNAAGFVELRA